MSVPTGRSIELITELIAVDTTSRDSNLPLIELIEDKLAAHGIESVKIPSPDGLKANLLATIPAVDGSRTGALCSPGTPTLFPSMARPGAANHSQPRCAMESSMAAVPAT